jgi:hypothetical protein
MTRFSSFAKMTVLQTDFGGMTVVDDGRTMALEDRDLVECLNVAADAQRIGAFESADKVLREVFTSHELTELPVDTLCPLTSRMLNVFSDYNIATVADLVQCKLSEVRGWYNFGKTSRFYLGERLRTFGLNLADQVDHTWVRPPVKRPLKRLDLLLVLPVFQLQLDQGYDEDHVLWALSSIAEGSSYRPSYTISLVPGNLYGLGTICNCTDLDPMTARRLVKDLTARGLLYESAPSTFTISSNGLLLVRDSS